MGGVAADGEVEWDVEGQDVGAHADEACGEAGEGDGAIRVEEKGGGMMGSVAKRDS